jgi:hypothetical protein
MQKIAKITKNIANKKARTTEEVSTTDNTT